MLRSVLLIASLLLTSCDAVMHGDPPSILSYTFNSDPPGAVLYIQGVREGFTPVTIHYNMNSEMRKKGFYTGPMVVRWPNGAEMNNELHILPIHDAQPHSYRYTFQPPIVPGREIDKQSGSQTEALRRQQEQQEQQQQLNLFGLNSPPLAA